MFGFVSILAKADQTPFADFGDLAVVVGLMILLWGLYVVLQAKLSAGWPSTAGEIVESTVEEKVDTDGDPGHRPIIRYAYVVDGVAFIGDATPTGPFRYWRGKELSLVAVSNFPVGTSVRVYFDPHAPSDSQLVVGIKRRSWRWVIVGIVVTLVGLGLLRL